jgi:ribosomal protein S18 acetylase RimI-like enzyme
MALKAGVQIAIQRAEPAEAAAIAQVHVASWKSTYPGIVSQAYLDSLDLQQFASRWTERLLLPETLVLVAVTAEGVCGFVSGGPLREPLPSTAVEGESWVGETGDGEIYALYVLQHAQRRGIGRALIRGVAQSLVDAGYQRAAVWVLEENPSRLFYERLGGRPIAKQMITIGGDELIEVAYAWDSLDDLIRP